MKKKILDHRVLQTADDCRWFMENVNMGLNMHGIYFFETKFNEIR